jgi:hypothetical protein
MPDEIVYDKAKYHLVGVFPAEQSFIHTGMFLGWVLDRDLYSEWFGQEFSDRQTVSRLETPCTPEQSDCVKNN